MRSASIGPEPRPCESRKSSSGRRTISGGRSCACASSGVSTMSAMRRLILACGARTVCARYTYSPAMRGRVLITLFAFGALAAPAQADRSVTVANNAFTPATIEVVEGEVITWNWTGPDMNHSVTSEVMNDQRASFDSHPNNPFPAAAPPGGQFSHEFEFDG